MQFSSVVLDVFEQILEYNSVTSPFFLTRHLTMFGSIWCFRNVKDFKNSEEEFVDY